MKTVAEIAREIGVSKTAIHKKIKQEPLKSSLQQFTQTVDNALRIDNEGEQLIKSTFSKREPLKEVGEPITKNIHTSITYVDELITSLRTENEYLRSQNKELHDEIKVEREHSRDIAEKLAELTKNGQELTRNSQLLQAKTAPTLLMSDSDQNGEGETQSNETPQKKNIFSRIFKNYAFLVTLFIFYFFLLKFICFADPCNVSFRGLNCFYQFISE